MIKNNPLKSEFQQPLFPDEEQISLGDLILTLAKHIKMIVVIPSLLCILVIVDVTFLEVIHIHPLRKLCHHLK